MRSIKINTISHTKGYETLETSNKYSRFASSSPNRTKSNKARGEDEEKLHLLARDANAAAARNMVI